MKKLLTVFGSITLLATTSAIVVSCEKIQQNNNNKTDSTMTVATKMDKDKKIDQPNSPKGMKNTHTMTGVMPKNALMTKTNYEDPLIFSELYDIDGHFSEYERKKHLSATSDMVLKNSRGVDLKEKGLIPKDTDYERLSDTEDLILENSNAIRTRR
ncbi:lipoprotein [Mycoplasma feriruminatoris]|uniref:lipoprotein n=1 Tax=Mycoplasma feriruminatoris TaxID=1179777 RepID=UPI0002A4D1B3|nr:lipoprotein [Mycoplasma feriruminatoris]UKS54535.1 putative lipoprotein [Mycoplasma feriruminatoris]VZK65710.1 hypothetical protein MF5292_00888 [Mycoplasma feriruminatoris]VZR75853.1 hypothetical protein MF5294_00886 [Mycoplasma feriruminatoris]VZR98638.1 hypothetical protein MF5293_00884 [Mycoplasma feriruminatoris]VZR98691.1 hypothetical protein MF5295_00892 [Mycoplasma feriruminatoris]